MALTNLLNPYNSGLLGGLCVTSSGLPTGTWTSNSTSGLAQVQMTSTVYSSTSNGLGGIFPMPTPIPMPSGTVAQQPWATGQKPPYFIELPDHPVAGDSITVYFDGTRWLEKSKIASRIDTRPNGGFSLDELEEARKIMEDCGAA